MMLNNRLIDNKKQIMINFNSKLIKIKIFFWKKMKSDNKKQIFIEFDYNNQNFFYLIG